MQPDPGHAVRGVWRPGLYFTNQVNEALGVTDTERLSAEQALQLLIERLYDLFLYIEPTTQGLQSFGHKSRELLILAVTEVENYWQRHARDAGLVGNRARRLNTRDYVKAKRRAVLGRLRGDPETIFIGSANKAICGVVGAKSHPIHWVV